VWLVGWWAGGLVVSWAWWVLVWAGAGVGGILFRD